MLRKEQLSLITLTMFCNCGHYGPSTVTDTHDAVTEPTGGATSATPQPHSERAERCKRRSPRGTGTWQCSRQGPSRAAPSCPLSSRTGQPPHGRVLCKRPHSPRAPSAYSRALTLCSRLARRFAQKGLSMRVPEAQALVEAVMDGKVHRDYVVVGGSQCTRQLAARTSPRAARDCRSPCAR